MTDATGAQDVTLSPSAEKEAQSPDTFYMYRLPNGASHQGSDLGYIKKEYPEATITNRVTMDEIGQPVFHQYQGQQPWEKAAAAEEVETVEAPAEQGAVEVETVEAPAEAPEKARSRR